MTKIWQCMFWTADPFATKLGLIVHYHKPECFMEKLDCCVQGQGHSKISKCQWMFVQMMSSEMLNLLTPSLVLWCIIMSQIVSQKRLVCCLQGQDHGEGSYNQKMTFWYVFWTADPFAPKLGLMAHHHKADCLVKRLGCSVVVKVKATEKVKNSGACSSGWYLLSCWRSVTRLIMVMQHHGPKKIGLLSSSSGSQWGLI